MSSEQPTGVDLIATERRRQIEVERFDAEHDAEHTDGELAWAAACYAAPAQIYKLGMLDHIGGEVFCFEDPWPGHWHARWDKRPRGLRDRLLDATAVEPAERISGLAKAGALIAAEIDRLQRLQQRLAAEGADDGASTRHYICAGQ